MILDMIYAVFKLFCSITDAMYHKVTNELGINFTFTYCKFSEIYTTLGIWVTIIILQNDYLEIWTTLDISLGALLQSIDNYYSALSVFS